MGSGSLRHRIASTDPDLSEEERELSGGGEEGGAAILDSKVA